MLRNEWEDERATADSIDASKNAVLRLKLNWEGMPFCLASNSGGDGQGPLTIGSQVLGCDDAALPSNLVTERPRGKAVQSSTVQYYDVPRYWTKRIKPHLQDEMLNKILVADFNDYTQGRWGEVFYPGTFPENI